MTKTKTAPALAGADAFRMDLRIAIAAAVGVSFVRTNEPFEAQQAVEDLCIVDKMPLRLWNTIRGWQVCNIEDEDLPITMIDTESADPIPALTKLYDHLMPPPDTAAAPSQLFPTNAVCVMMWPDFYIREIPQMRILLAALTLELQHSTQRLVMIVPPTFQIPDELAEMVPIIDFKLPLQNELMAIYKNIRENDLKPNQKALTREFNDADAHAICSAGAGMTRSEFASALCAAWVSMELRQLRGIDAFRNEIMIRKVSLVKRSEVLEVLEPVDMDDVGGLDLFKTWLEKRAACFSEEARKAQVDTPKGVAAIGPPGTGKSLMARAAGSVLQVPVIKYDLSRIFGSLVGESEARMAKSLQMIDAMAPCVCMVDEIDKVFQTNSGGGDGGTSARVLGKLLTHMQESTKPIFWMLTANRVDNLPPELLRDGRLDEKFSVTTPTEEERMAIFAIHLRKRGIDIAKLSGMERVIEASNGFVGGEIEAVVKEAKVEAFHDGEKLTVPYLLAACKTKKPLSKSFAAQFKAMAEWAEQHARPSSSLHRPRGAGSVSRTRGRVRSMGRDDASDEMEG